MVDKSRKRKHIQSESRGAAKAAPVRHPRAVVQPEFPQLDRLIHERLRLGIVSALAVNASLSFSDLKWLLKTSDGNLSVHARKLEDAGYITCVKHFEGRVPRSDYRLTVGGRRELEQYLQDMERVIRLTREQ